MATKTIPAPLHGKVALVTGASRGIGAETVLDFTRKGISHIAITFLSSSNLANNVLSTARGINPDLITTAIQGDVRDPNFGAQVVAAALKGLNVSHIDIVVSNAALPASNDHATAATMTKKAFDIVMTAQTWAPLSLSLEAIKVMPEGGRIILNSSIASKLANGDPFLLHGASKAAMDSIARNLAVIYGRSKHITVNSISIGCTATESLDRAIQLVGPGHREMCENYSPLKRIGTVKEVANIISFVASSEASWINGNQIPANGGSLLSLQS